MRRTLRNEDTPEGKAIWAAVDKAASRAPKWMKERIESLELNLPGAIKPREVVGMATRELCKRCWRFNPIGFSVPDEVWNRVVPEGLREGVLCIMCFDDFATEHGVDWTEEGVELFPVSGIMHLRYGLGGGDTK